MNIVRRLTLTVVVAGLVALAVYGFGWSQANADDDRRESGITGRAAGDEPRPAPSDEPASATDPTPTPDPTSEPTVPAEQPEPTQDPTLEPTPEPKPAEPAEPRLQPGPALLSPGDDNAEVRELQARLRQIDWFEGDVTGLYGDLTTAAVEGFQAKREIPVTGEVDQRTMDRLLAMTTEPTAAELANQLGENTPGALDPRCTTGRVLCIDKTSRTLRYVVDGAVVQTVDVRFGSESTPTREGAFSVTYKDADHVSSLYGSSMPYSMFFSRGQAVHYSSDFASVGYAGASHGCVNVRDYDALASLYDQVQVGDPVIVYWS
ncbi:L,D-transpeptidase family protein [Nocardioides marinquilinus]|uniref:L,D-transpeptidase family protein n=1 Tax=Nocardioides marinquilinus TaxID=1210400 RepID=A0ABP9PIS7_9ACTN